MKKVLFYLIFILALFLFCRPAWAVTYTVCSSGCNETTIQAVFDKYDLNGGDIVDITDSRIYQEAILWGVNDGGAPGSPVTLTSSGGAIINGSTNRYALNLNSPSYIKISNLTIKGADYGIFSHGANNVFDNLIIKDAKLAGIWTDKPNQVISNCDISNTGSSAIFLGNGVSGEGSDNTVIFGNTLHDGANTVGDMECIGIYQSSNVNVYDNHCYNYMRGIEIAGAVGDSNINIFNNKIHNCTLWGFQWCNHNSGSVYNNVIYDNKGAWGLRVTTDMDVPAMVSVYNNALYGNGSGDQAQLVVYGTTGVPHASYSVIAKNNISANPVSRHVYVSSNIVSSAVLDNNLYYPEGNDKWTWGAKTNIDTLSNWRSESNQDAHSLVFDPLFVNAAANDFHLLFGSPAINAGINVGLTADFAGNPIVGLPDIGAYEYQSSQAPVIDTIPPAAPSGFSIALKESFSQFALSQLNPLLLLSSVSSFASKIKYYLSVLNQPAKFKF